MTDAREIGGLPLRVAMDTVTHRVLPGAEACGGIQARAWMQVEIAVVAEQYRRIAAAEIERLTAEVRDSCEDEYRDALSDLVSLESEMRAIGGGPGFAQRNARAWAVAEELVRIEQ